MVTTSCANRCEEVRPLWTETRQLACRGDHVGGSDNHHRHCCVHCRPAAEHCDQVPARSDTKCTTIGEEASSYRCQAARAASSPARQDDHLCDIRSSDEGDLLCRHDDEVC